MGNNVVNKVQERVFAETAASLLQVDWTFKEIPEPLDFEVQTATESFGLEIRQIFVDSESHFGSPTKRDEAKNIRNISLLAKKYYAMGGSPISANFLGEIQPGSVDKIVLGMIESAPKVFEERAVFQTSEIKVFMTSLPKVFGEYSNWNFVRDKVGWVKDISNSELQYAVNKKTPKLESYKRKYKNVDLLLVSDRTFNSGKFTFGSILGIVNPGFRNIYFMSYPESIHLVG